MLLSLCRQASSCCSQHNADQEHTHHVAHSIMQIKSIHIMLLTAPDMAHQNEQWQCLGNALLEQKLRYNAILQAHRTALKSRLQQLPTLVQSVNLDICLVYLTQHGCCVSERLFCRFDIVLFCHLAALPQRLRLHWYLNFYQRRMLVC